MDFISSPGSMTSWSVERYRSGETIALVPTMGAFHQAHLLLMREAAERCDRVVVSLFVNPLQFGPHEDYAAYPRDLQGDVDFARNEAVDVVFAPQPEAMYPDEMMTQVQVAGITETLCGVDRPGHFDGVATVVAKLFHIVMPQVAVFGRKDLQQLAVIRRMVHDLNWNIEIIGHPIVREEDGLAMSSRNAYLAPEERQSALALYQAIKFARQQVLQGQSDVAALVEDVRSMLKADERIRLDYVSIVNRHTLAVATTVDEGSVLALAAHVGTTRLIDNGALMGEN